MSLRSFHVIFIVASVILLALTCLWSWQKYQAMHSGAYLAAFTGALTLAISLIIYEIHFIKNTHEPL